MGVSAGIAGVCTSARFRKHSSRWMLQWRIGFKGNKSTLAQWSTQEWLHFLRALPQKLDALRMRRLDSAWRLTESGCNDEILDQWLLMAIRNHYEVAYPRLEEEFLVAVGRRKYVKPLYDALDMKRASAIYEKARRGYHPDHADDHRRSNSSEGQMKRCYRGERNASERGVVCGRKMQGPLIQRPTERRNPARGLG